MYKFIFVLLVVVGMATASNAQEKQNMKQSDNKPLVAYFSVTGTTARAAEKLSRVTGGELYAITPVESYTNADLDWNDKRSRSSVEMNDPKSRPAIQEAKKNIADYDVIFIGYPIWWNLAPRIIDTFIETHHLAGKTLIPFATSGGSGITNSVDALKKAYPDLNWKEGKLLNRMDENGIREWIGKTSKDERSPEGTLIFFWLCRKDLAFCTCSCSVTRSLLSVSWLFLSLTGGTPHFAKKLYVTFPSDTRAFRKK